jgi:hypothetical protein
MYGLISRINAVDGQRDALAAILLEGTKAMPGCLSYVIRYRLDSHLQRIRLRNREVQLLTAGLTRRRTREWSRRSSARSRVPAGAAHSQR